MSGAAEYNFDGLVGPTHNYGGLARGNLASQQHRQRVSHPRQAALEGLEKMKFMMDLGVGQGVLPPPERPDVGALRRLGFSGSDADVLAQAWREAPGILAACASASSMWAANAATVSPSADTPDRRVHITPANLVSHFHRRLEVETTAAALKAIFTGEPFVHHAALPASAEFADEGAANHIRLCADHGGRGIEVFAFGREPNEERGAARAGRFAGRQSLEASRAVARLHGLQDRAIFVRQHADAIDAGAFHNDVVAVGHRHVLLCHERAFAEGGRVIDDLRRGFAAETGAELLCIAVPETVLPLADAVRSYLFNSQLITVADGTMALVAPAECREMATAAAAIALIRDQVPVISAVHFVNVRQSMQNGGGPACLRLRVVLMEEERAAVHQGTILTEALYGKLRAWVERHYRETLSPGDLADAKLLEESRAALDELTGILDLGAFYGFQK